jgi:hypothetical protein
MISDLKLLYKPSSESSFLSYEVFPKQGDCGFERFFLAGSEMNYFFISCSFLADSWLSGGLSGFFWLLLAKEIDLL